MACTSRRGVPRSRTEHRPDLPVISTLLSLNPLLLTSRRQRERDSRESDHALVRAIEWYPVDQLRHLRADTRPYPYDSRRCRAFGADDPERAEALRGGQQLPWRHVRHLRERNHFAGAGGLHLQRAEAGKYRPHSDHAGRQCAAGANRSRPSWECGTACAAAPSSSTPRRPSARSSTSGRSSSDESEEERLTSGYRDSGMG